MKLRRPKPATRMLIILMALAGVGVTPVVLSACGENAAAECCCARAPEPSCCEIPAEAPEETPDAGKHCTCDFSSSPAVPAQPERISPPEGRSMSEVAVTGATGNACFSITPLLLGSAARLHSRSGSRTEPLYRLDCTYLL